MQRPDLEKDSQTKGAEGILTRSKKGIGAKANEDREEWMEEVRTHCERCSDDEEEPSRVQERRMQEQTGRGDIGEAWMRKRVEVSGQSFEDQ